MFEVIYKKSAQQHLKKIALWYLDKKAGLEQRFLDEIDNATDILSINPFFAFRYKSLRSYVLKKFPYIIFYRVEEEKSVVIVFAVLHTSRNTFKNNS